MHLLTVSLCLASVCATTVAQTQPERVRVDAVVATVNDGAILLSEVNTLAKGRILGLEAQLGPLSPEQKLDVLRLELRNRIDMHRMAQAAKTFGIYKPEQVEQLLQMELERAKQEQVRDFGGYVELSRELQRQNRTWEIYEGEQRVEKLYDFAREFAVFRRLQKQQNLYLTPRMLREAYEAMKQRFVHPAEAVLAIVRFRGADAEASARAAAETWRTEPLTARDLADRHQGGTALQEVRASALTRDLLEFGLAGPLDRVDVFPTADGAQVVKIVQYLPARDGRFEDPEVQAELRQICQNAVIKEFEAQALERARQRTEVWTADSIR